ncbi:MAG: hypothetical protein LC808_36085, partial [Actinobacteria bacterium]|nr:hypothetical protein [Actinomycetota bacterium]
CLTSWTGPDPAPQQTRYAFNRTLLAPGWAHAVKPVNPRPHRDEPDTVETLEKDSLDHQRQGLEAAD